MYCRNKVVQAVFHARDLPRGCYPGRCAYVFLRPDTAPVLGVVLLTPPTLLRFSLLNSFVGIRRERAYL